MKKRWRGLLISLVVGFPSGWALAEIIKGNFIWIIATIPFLVWLGILTRSIWLIMHNDERYKNSWVSRI